MIGLRRFFAGGARPAEDSVLILADVADALGRCGPLIERLTDGRARLTVVVIATTPDEATRLRVQYPGAEIRLLPPLASWVSFATLSTLRVRAALSFAPSSLPAAKRRLLRGAIVRGVPVFDLEEARLTPLSAVAEGMTGDPCPDALAAHLVRAAGVERLPGWSLDCGAAALSDLPLRRLTGGYITPLAGVDTVADRLGHPQTILCLGNGPSGADQRLAEISRDALFRVNHDWRAKGFLDAPDMVFVGVKRSMRKLGARLMGVATARKSHALIACRLLEPWHGRATFAVVDEFAKDISPQIQGPLRPTTGAYMIAAAVALGPRRIVVAGMDMFRHVDGAYAAPADGAAPEINAYTPSHDFETDAAFILGCLRHFRGELVVYSRAFADLAAELGEEASFELVDRSDGK